MSKLSQFEFDDTRQLPPRKQVPAYLRETKPQPASGFDRTTNTLVKLVCFLILLGAIAMGARYLYTNNPSNEYLDNTIKDSQRINKQIEDFQQRRHDRIMRQLGGGY